MDPDSITHYITESFDGLDVVAASGDSFFFYDPEKSIDPARRLPFATLVTSDQYDDFSNLDRPSVFRLNVGVSPQTFRALFSAGTSTSGAGGGVESDVDFTALDRIMPHPVYGTMFWICVLNPSVATFVSVRPLLAEAYDRAKSRPANVRPADPS